MFLHFSFVNCDLSYTPGSIVTRIIILNVEEWVVLCRVLNVIWFVSVVVGGKVLICCSLFKSVLLSAECGHILIWKWLCICDRNVLSNKIACTALEEDCNLNLQFFAWGVWRWKQTYSKAVSQNCLSRCSERPERLVWCDV